MPIDAEDSGFLSRWSRRKAQVRQGAALEPSAESPPEPLAAVADRPAQAVSPAPPGAVPAPVSARSGTAQSPTPAPQPDSAPLPTLADVAALTRDSDYSRFVANTVQPDVKNAALAKLFTDPHFNVMDGLDTYIDDYGKPDPLPAGMLRQMLQAHVLRLFDDEDERAKTEAAASEPPANAIEAQPPCSAAPTTDPAPDENTDLQLQPDDDAGRACAAAGTGENAGRAH